MATRVADGFAPIKGDMSIWREVLLGSTRSAAVIETTRTSEVIPYVSHMPSQREGLFR